MFLEFLLLGVAALSETIAVWLIGRLWSRKVSAPIPQKAFWTLVLLVPVFGPIFYGGFSSVPGVQPSDQRAKRTRNDWAGGI